MSALGPVGSEHQLGQATATSFSSSPFHPTGSLPAAGKARACYKSMVVYCRPADFGRKSRFVLELLPQESPFTLFGGRVPLLK